LKHAVNGYQSRVDVAVMLAGGKPSKAKARPQGAKQTPDQIAANLRSWVSATKHLGPKPNPRD